MIISTIIFSVMGGLFVLAAGFVAMTSFEPRESPLPGLGRLALVALVGVIVETGIARSLSVDLRTGLIAVAVFASLLSAVILLVRPLVLLWDRIPALRRRSEDRMIRQGYHPDGHGGWIRRASDLS